MPRLGGHGNVVVVRGLGGRGSISMGMRWVGSRMRMGRAFMIGAPASSRILVLLKPILKYKL